MNYYKRYPKMAYASLALLAAAVVLLWADWATLKQVSVVGFLAQAIPALKNGGLSFAGMYSLISSLNKLGNELNGILGGYVGEDLQTVFTMLKVLNAVVLILLAGTILAAVYCVYARLTWKSGLKEGIYFLFFIGDLAMMVLLVSQLNGLLGAGTFDIGIWGIAAVVCALLSEILWEEASFNTPKPGTEENKVTA